MKMPKLALLDLIATLVFTVLTYKRFMGINVSASKLLIPYIAWLILAFTLNLYIVVMN